MLLARLRVPLRLASLLQDAAPGLAALDHLLSVRPERLLIVSRSGRLLGGSPAGERLLARHPALATAIRDLLLTPERQRRRLLALPQLATAFISPCSPHGGSAAYLVEIGSDSSASARLSGRQAELLELLAEGLRNKAIAERMQLSAATVKTMLERLYRRAGVTGRVGLLRWARSH